MKVIAFILTAYLLALVVVPCCAFDNCPDDKMITEQKANQGDNCGSCSPFFNCECCASATINIETVRFNFFTPIIKKIYSGFISSYMPEVHYDFWQPPRVG